MGTLDQFIKQQYINLETFRKNGASLKTPVWFVQEGQTLYVLTEANSGKVKRIRNNARINLTPCKMDGTSSGTWMPANAMEICDPEVLKKIDRLMDRKYGLMKKFFSLGAARQGRQNTILAIQLIE